jgi:CBS domain-containing protein
MVMLSELLRFDVVDRGGRRARLDDLALAVLDDDYPPVTEIHFLQEDGPRHLTWDAVEQIGPGRRFVVDDLEKAAPGNGEAHGREVLLKHDILDALIIDLLNRRTTRANDLALDEEDGILRLKAVDASIGAMLRRISRGAYRHVDQRSLYDWQYVEFLRGDPKAVENGEGYRLRIGRLPAGEIAQLADYVPYLHAAELLKLLPDDKAADVLQAMSVERQRQVIEELDDDEASRLLMRMSPDLATDLAGRLPLGMMRRLLGRMPKKNSDRIVELLRYPENTVGGVMINNMIYLTGDADAAAAREKIAQLLGKTDFVSLIFLVETEENRKVRGSVMLRDLLAAEGREKLEDLMDPYIAVLDPLGSAKEAAYRIVGGQLLAMPVAEADGRLVGAMTLSSAIGQLLPPTSSLSTLRVFS